MQLVAPDILEEVCGLSPLACGVSFSLGGLLWLFGWRAHRFWIVLSMTAAAGIIGLSTQEEGGAKSVAAALLLASAAGTMALALVRVVAFGAGGAVACVVARELAPGWHELFFCFLGGGLLGLMLFRVWMMALTSSAASLLMGYSGLSLAHNLAKLDVTTLTSQHGNLLDWGCGGVAALGLLLQFSLDRRREKRRRRAPRDQKLVASGGGRWNLANAPRRAA